MAKKTKKKKAAAKKKPVKKTLKKRALKKRTAKARPGIRRTSARTKPNASPAKAKPKEEVVEGKLLGKVEDYYAHVGVVAMTLQEEISLGDTIRVKGHTTDLTQSVGSMQINHADVTNARAGDAVGVKVNDKCRKGDKVYKI